MCPKYLLTGLMAFALTIGSSPAGADGKQAVTGTVGLGAFVPTGDDADVSKASVALQIGADVQLAGRLGVQAEFSWIPINLESAPRPANTLIEARQVSVAAGLRLSTRPLSMGDRVPSAYIAGRIGFSRIAVTADTTTSVPGWIGRPLDATQNLPAFSFPTRVTENAFLISPRAGILLHPTGNTLVDISITPSFLFDGGEVTTQIIATIGFGMLGDLN